MLQGICPVVYLSKTPVNLEQLGSSTFFHQSQYFLRLTGIKDAGHTSKVIQKGTFSIPRIDLVVINTILSLDELLNPAQIELDFACERFRQR